MQIISNEQLIDAVDQVNVTAQILISTIFDALSQNFASLFTNAIKDIQSNSRVDILAYSIFFILIAFVLYNLKQGKNR